jgi:hypothetical protein
MKLNKIILPIFKSKYPNILNVGYTDNKTRKRKLEKDVVLVILDSTGSMGEYLNSKRKISKAGAIKQVLNNLSKNFTLEILPFNVVPHEICSVQYIPEPYECTNFTPLVPELKRQLAKNIYGAVLFVSDGLPSEEKSEADKAIKSLGNMTREADANPVSIAVGDDADGVACALFSGNRGYECFLKYEDQFSNLVDDISNGINCNYVLIDSGEYIPVESTGNYYYLTSEENTEITPDLSIENIMKYLNIILLQEFSNENSDYNELKEFVEFIAKNITDSVNKNMIINHFNNMINNVVYKTKEQTNTPSMTSAKKNAFRALSQQV